WPVLAGPAFRVGSPGARGDRDDPRAEGAPAVGGPAHADFAVRAVADRVRVPGDPDVAVGGDCHLGWPGEPLARGRYVASHRRPRRALVGRAGEPDGSVRLVEVVPDHVQVVGGRA